MHKISELFPILIVEDNPVDRTILQNQLEREGYSVVAVSDGKEALAKLEQMYFPIVITDWLMPNINGLELCEIIRSRDFPGYVSIIFITSLNTPDDLLHGLEAGADDFFTKPFNRAELSARLKNAVRHHDMARKLSNAYEEIKLLATLDPLTKLNNRAYLFENLSSEILRSKRYHHPLSLVMCDIDHFKKVNDKYGHRAGDHVLIAFSNFIKSRTRIHIDLVARYGGEEFLLVLPETDLAGAEVLASRICRELSAEIISLPDGEISITASFGVAGFTEFPKKELVAEIFIDQADQQLYKAKNNGRNMVCAGQV